MNLTMQNVTNNLRAASPYILFGTGVVSLGGAIFTAIRATMALEPVLDQHQAEAETIDEVYHNEIGDATEGGTIDELAEEINKKRNKEVRKLYLRTSGRIARLYARCAAFTALSVGSFTWCTGILRGRYLVAAGAFSEFSTKFDNYRERVIEEYGEDADEALYYGLKKEKITVEEEDPETGNKKKVKKDILIGEPAGEFTRRWEKYDWQTKLGSTQWDSSNVYNKNYIFGRLQQYQMNLNAGKMVHLDRVLDDLGYENDILPTDHLAGWLPGDFIEFGIEDKYYDKYKDVRDFLDDESTEVTLRFNCRRDILGLLRIDS